MKIKSQFRADYVHMMHKKIDRALSCLVIESLVSPSLGEFINTCFSQYEDFNNFPGQVYFIVIIDACNASASIVIEGS